MLYNSLIWLMNRTNNDPNILPDTRIELVPINSRFDRGYSLTGALQLINQEKVAAIIGESNSRNTVTMAVAAAVNNVLHCSNLATTPQLSNKVDYPSTFRTQSNAALQARGILALVNSFNKTTIGILSSSDEFGNGVTQYLQLNAPLYNITVSLVVVYDVSKDDYRDDLRQFIEGQVQTIVMIAAQFPVVNVMMSASQLGMLDGSYWFVSTTGWTEGMFSSSAGQQFIKNITGTWQVQTPLQDDVNVYPDNSNIEAVEFRKWWTSLFYSNEFDPAPGVTKTYNASAFIAPYSPATFGIIPPSNCANDSQLAVANSIYKFLIPKDANTILAAAGNMCTGDKLKYLEGYLSIFALNTKYMIMKPTDFMHNTVKCGKILTGLFDYYTKTGKITVDQINNRELMTLAKGNITQLINNASLVDSFGVNITVDNGGDLLMDQEIWTYKLVNISSKKTIVQGTPVGRWLRESNVVTLKSDPLLFLGGKTAPPPTPVIPIVQFDAKKGLRYAFDAIVAVCSLFTIGLFAYMMAYQKMKIFMASSPVFLGLILLGANISYVGVYLFSMYPMTDGSCIVFGWFKYIGFAVVFGALLVKTYRISVIFVSKKNKARKLNDSVMLMYFGVIVAIWAAILAVWTIIPSQRPFLETESIANVAKNGTITHFFQTPHCNFTNYNYINLAAMVITLGAGVWLTYSVRNTPSAFNESKWIALAIYNWVVIGIVLVSFLGYFGDYDSDFISKNAISNFAVKDPDVIFVMEALVVILTQTGVAAVLFGPKMLEIQAGRGNNNDTFVSTNSSHGGGTNNNTNHDAGGKSSILGQSSVVDETARLLKSKDAQISKLEAELQELKAKLSGEK
ncbi:hypothetical protein HDU97_001615 [Phlyctochytrium planicorne]|nr:hypothetical protein HDU97_001615 [Phlyctochytrium planicorne]